MKPYSFYILLVSALPVIFGCEKILNIQINPAEKKYVIEASINDNPNSFVVNISQTMALADSNKFYGIEGAEVTVWEEGGRTVVAKPEAVGVYRANIGGRPGHTYHLQVKIKGQTFTASSTMPVKVPLDTVFVSERVFLGKLRKMAAVQFKDPPGMYNAYRFVQRVDGVKENTIFVYDDNITDGRQVTYELHVFSQKDYTLKPDDQLRIDMYCINKTSFNYWFSLTQASLGQSQSASPGNPISNMQGGALGYFSAHTFETKSIVVH